MPAHDPRTRTAIARQAAHHKWAITDPAEGTQAARQAFADRFLALVPAEITDPAERARRADHLRRAYFIDLGRRSGKARRLRRGI